jgi:hypothetical protein
MRVTHELTLTRLCPVDDGIDHYRVRIETTRLLTVEKIYAAIGGLPEKEYQERLTVLLAAALDAKVTTIGFHSGVKTTCEAG